MLRKKKKPMPKVRRQRRNVKAVITTVSASHTSRRLRFTYLIICGVLDLIGRLGH